MIQSILSYLWKRREADTEPPLSLDEAYKVVSECDRLPNKAVENEEDELRTYEVSSRVGKITEVRNDTFVVDNKHEFKSEVKNLFVGTKISYQLIKSLEDIKVNDVHVIENDWNVVVTGKHFWHERTLICSVVKRKGRLLTLTPGDIEVHLNDICAEFIPVAGDWVELCAKCEVDENVVDLNGKIVELSKLRPVRPQLKLGVISRWDPHEGEGLMDKNVFFTRDSLYCGYIPIKGDKVCAEIIESNQGRCTWRALKIIPDYLQSKENKSLGDTEKQHLQNSHESVTVTDNISLSFTKLGEIKLFTIEVEVKEDIQLVCIELPNVCGQCKLLSSVDHNFLKPNQPLTIRCECKARNIGETCESIIFHFEHFKLRRLVTINVVSNRPNKIKQGKLPKQIVSRSNRDVIKGQRINMSVRFVPLQLPDFTVPERLVKLLTIHRADADNNLLKTELEKMKPCLVTTLNFLNFEDKFHTLIHLDEIHTILDMQNYDQERACFIKNGEYLMLEIANLAERRPSVILGDRVFARNIHDPKSPDYEGYIHRMSKNHVYIKFSQMFHDSYDGEDYSVYIVHSRMTFRRKHFAVNLAVKNLGTDWLFPMKTVEKEPQIEFVFDSYSDIINSDEVATVDNKESHNIRGKRLLLEKLQKFQDGVDEVPIRKLEWYNKSLNYHQKESVRNILLGVCRPLPYIIFGPPGTGKTVTLVESILQVLRLIPHSRILVTAPSNSAANLLALRLIDSGVLKPGDLIRMVAMTAVATVPARLAPYCATANLEREGTETSLPIVATNGLVLGYSSAVLGRHRITVSTCSSAGVLYGMGFSKGHFSHIFVDEAGQTSEPSLLIPLAFLDVSSGQAVLAGDPMQLGPVILSKFAANYGLEESFLERMINRFPYTRDPDGFPKTFGYDPRLITKLIYNYRSLPDLLKLPSLLFYNDDLLPTISSEDSKEAALLQTVKEILPKTKRGKVASMVFHPVIGENFQTDDSPSWYNPNEASQVFYYVNELYRLGLNAADIGVITPYKAQIKQLLELFKEAEFDMPKIGTVEDFQGQEYNVIILSTVRSNTKFIAADIKYTMGFISIPRRVNVSITRAKTLLIIVGNNRLLSTDRCWRSVINYCIDMGSFVGSENK